MIYAENILNAYHSRARSRDWAKWVNDNPMLANMLAEAEAIAEGVK